MLFGPSSCGNKAPGKIGDRENRKSGTGKIENRGQGKSKIGDRRDVHVLFRKGPVKGFGIRRKDELAAVAALRNMMRHINCYHTS
jgi:hypothetical protein